MKKAFFCMLLMTIFSSCHSDKIVSEEIQKEYYDAIEDYILSKREYDQFLLIPAKKFFTERDDIDGILIGPLYPVILELMETNALILTRFPSNQTVYYTTDFKDIFVKRNLNFKTIKDSVFSYKLNGVDIYDRNPLINFLKRSRLFYYNENKLFTNIQPDTLFLPIVLEPQHFKKPQHFKTDFTEISDQ